MEAYLARKWGLTDQLSSDHPYVSWSIAEVNTGADRDFSVGGISAAEKFNGTIDEIKVYDQGLSSAEVTCFI